MISVWSVLVRLWHLADVASGRLNVRYSGKKRTSLSPLSIPLQLPSTPMRVFAIGIEDPLTIAVDRL
jgi:hypothetical protein